MELQNPPIGSIVAFAGPIQKLLEEATNWALCDGRLVDRKQAKWSPLFERIGSSWGGDGADGFRLPALNGIFLRGVNTPPAAVTDRTSVAGVDPDADGRSQTQPGGHAKDDVGTRQAFGVEQHNHTLHDPGHQHDIPVNFDRQAASSAYERSSGDQPPPHPVTNKSATGITIDSYGGAETRPVNASVFWIIRIS